MKHKFSTFSALPTELSREIFLYPERDSDPHQKIRNLTFLQLNYQGKCTESWVRTNDLVSMNHTLLPTELSRQIKDKQLKFSESEL